MLTFLLYGLLWCICGYVIVRHLLHIDDTLMLIPLSPAVGYILFTVLNNLFLHLLPVTWGMWGVPAVMLVGAGIVWHKMSPPARLRWHLRGKETVFLMWFTLFFGALIYRTFWVNTSWDEFDHSPSAVMIAYEGLPINTYENKDVCYYHHYAHNMNTGILFRQSGMSVRAADAFLVVFTTYVALGLCIVFLWRLMEKQGVYWAALGSVLFVVSAQASWLPALLQLPIITNLTEVSPMFAALSERSLYEINAWLARPLIFSMPTAEEQSFWVIGFVALLAGLSIKVEDPIWKYIGLGILTALVAVMYTTALPIIAITIGMWLLVRVWIHRQAPRHTLTQLLVYTASTLLVVVMQGGLVTASLFCDSQLDPELRAVDDVATTLTAFEVRVVPQYLSGNSNEFVRVDSVRGMFNFLYDWGIVPLLFPFLLLYYFRRVSWRAGVLLVVSGILTSFPFFLTLGFSPHNMSRFATMSFWLIAAMSALLLRALWQHTIAHKILVIILILMMATSGLNHFTSLLVVEQRENLSLMMDPLDLQVQEEWLGRLDARANAVWDPSTFASFSKGIGRSVTVFGTYSCYPGDYRYQSPTLLPEWDETLDPNILLRLGCNYLYIDDEWYGSLPPEKQTFLTDFPQYELVQEWEQDGAFRRLYAINPPADGI